MQEPLCTYQRYPRFRQVCERLNEEQKSFLSATGQLPKYECSALDSIKEILDDMDQLHQDTWRFTLIFFSTLSLQNKANAKAIAQTFADIIFKPSEIGANDMIMWRLFTDLLALMIDNHEYLFTGLTRRNSCGEEVVDTSSTLAGEPKVEIVDASDIESIKQASEKSSGAYEK
jgi:RhoGAP domain